MTFAEVAIGLAEQPKAAPEGSGLELLMGGMAIRVTDRTDMGLLMRVVHALRTIPA
jgi:hypothetical protein